MIGYIESRVRFETIDGVIGEKTGRSRTGYSSNIAQLKQNSITNALCLFLYDLGIFSSYDGAYDEIESYKVLSSRFVISRMTEKKHLKIRRTKKTKSEPMRRETIKRENMKRERRAYKKKIMHKKKGQKRITKKKTTKKLQKRE